MARERLGLHGFGNGIAIPHCRLAGLQQPLCVLFHLQQTVDFDSLDGAPVDLVFVLLVPEAASEQHLTLLRQIAGILDRADIRERLRRPRIARRSIRSSSRPRADTDMHLIIVSGRSGSGKSTALNVLEDNGFYCIDNLPASLLPDLAQHALTRHGAAPAQGRPVHRLHAICPASCNAFPNCSNRCAAATSAATSSTGRR